MKKRLIVFWLCTACPVMAAAASHPCLKIGRSPDIAIRQVMKDQLKIDVGRIVEDKTKMELLAAKPVTRLLAEEVYQRETSFHSGDKDETIRLIMGENAKNLIIKYTYKNRDGRENVFISSYIVNDDECSVLFNGYITVSREF